MSLLKNTYTYSILKNLKKYRGSNTQNRLHHYKSSDQQIQPIKDKIDYDIILRQSKGQLMIRQFLFQQKMPQIKINFPHINLKPLGVWSYEKICDVYGQQPVSQAQKDIQIILQNFKDNLQWRISKYYERIGKKNYNFLLREQLNKIQNMNNQQFQKFIQIISREQEQ